MSVTAFADPKFSLVSPLTAGAGIATELNASVAASVAERWEGVIAELVRVGKLSDDWDGQGGRAPQQNNVDRATAWVQAMRSWPQAIPPDQVVPGVAGEVYFVWQAPGWLLEAEIGDPQQVEWMLVAQGRPTKQWETNQEVLWLVARLPETGSLKIATVQS